MKTFKDFFETSENPVIQACIDATANLDNIKAEGLADDDILFFDSNEARKMKDDAIVDLYNKLKDAGITKFIWYEYEYGFIMTLRYRMQLAGFQFGDMVKFDITAVKKTTNGVSRRKGQIGQYIIIE